jgi:hypothetical protein
MTWEKHSDYRYSGRHRGVELHLIYCGMPPRILNYTVDQGWWSARYRAVGMDRTVRIPQPLDGHGIPRPIRGLAEAQRLAEEFAEQLPPTKEGKE